MGRQAGPHRNHPAPCHSELLPVRTAAGAASRRRRHSCSSSKTNGARPRADCRRADPSPCPSRAAVVGRLSDSHVACGVVRVACGSSSPGNAGDRAKTGRAEHARYTVGRAPEAHLKSFGFQWRAGTCVEVNSRVLSEAELHGGHRFRWTRKRGLAVVPEFGPPPPPIAPPGLASCPMQWRLPRVPALASSGFALPVAARAWARGRRWEALAPCDTQEYLEATAPPPAFKTATQQKL